MAKRTVFSRRFGKCKASIRYDSSVKEYEYVVVGPTKKSPWSGSGFTDDKKDARASLADMIKRMHKAGVCRVDKPRWTPESDAWAMKLGGARRRRRG